MEEERECKKVDLEWLFYAVLFLAAMESLSVDMLLV